MRVGGDRDLPFAPVLMAFLASWIGFLCHIRLLFRQAAEG